ncbi:hypothetical protein GCM10010964_05950 [Caldovatus sediminis]|uniref:DUF29 domain-containing protein n=1 Tax=Caldovatus sediminis TaxID=2041189 RepID=A0A8J2Z8X0_9PROT|nr:DUF29 family protein [Caldovatus sediminis]GGG20551.1 hypothetical protein GCM10010964_05950 [Caldovatus sediminis]
MPDDLYHRDILAWSRAQADRLRRVAAGERVNDVDWEHVIEEIEEVGNSELNSVRSHLRNALLHAFKVLAWPDDQAVNHWSGEIATFLGNARDRFQPGMAQHIDTAAIYARALKEVRRLPMSGRAPLPLPETIDLSIEDLANEDFGAADLLDRIRAAIPSVPGV